MKNIAIVTGAGEGFGKELTKLVLNEKNIDEIWAIGRNEEKLARLKAELGERITPLALDLSDRKSYDRVAEYLKKEPTRVAFLINNAGYAKFCAYYDVDVEGTLNMIDLNVCAMVALCLVCIPYMDKGCRIMNVSSLSSFFPLPYLNTYASTKVFVRNYTRALNVELREKGITATAVCPGWMSTSLYSRAKIGAKKEANNYFGMNHPADVARKAFKDTKKGKAFSTYGIYVKSIHLLSKLLPQRLLMSLWLIQQRIKSTK